MNIVSVKNLCVKYQSTEVLSDVSFEVAAGDYLGIVGPNGSGKTTLIRAIFGLTEISKGSVSIFSEDIAKFKNWDKIGYLPQKIVSFNPHFPAAVTEIVALGLLGKKHFPRRISKEDDTKIDKILKLLDITGIKGNLIGELSGGQQQRVLLARAMVSEPSVLVLDEPTTALDPEAREKFFSILEGLNKKSGVTIILVTHDMMNIGRYASKMLYIDRKLIFYGGFGDFCSSSEVTSYFGEFAQHAICHRHEKGK